MKRLIFLVFFLASQVGLKAQDLGTWNILNIKYGLNEKWTLFGESQIRSLKFYDHFHYYENKVGIEYKIHPEFKLALAVGDYDTYASGGTFENPKNNDEFRIWPQLLFTHKVAKIKLEQRYRAEMRFTLNGYRNRFRYKVGVSYPFGKSEKLKDRFEIGASNEIFFTDRAPYFERNRLQFFFNVKINESVSTMIGYLHQFDYQINDETGRDFLQLGLSFRLKRK
jgi:hypothetical protein